MSRWGKSFLAALALGTLTPCVRAEVIIQYFETSWAEVARRMPELAEAGYTAIWMPPPFKCGGQLSVGFDTFDRFDIGSIDQHGGYRTKYGVEADLINLMETAHRFGIRVYFDNVMAHNGGPIPGYDENTPITVQPGFVPEDFHLLKRADGFYRKMPDWPDGDWKDEWQVLHRNPFGIDIAQENYNGSQINESFGAYEGAQFPKWKGIRQPDNPEYYLDSDLPIATNGTGGTVYTFANKEAYQDTGWTTNGVTYVGAGDGKFSWDDDNLNGQHDVGETSESFTDTGIDPSNPAHQIAQWGFGNSKYDMGNPKAEDVNEFLYRAVRWFEDKTHADGFRLDAVKHVPFYFFGITTGDKDPSSSGYNGNIQEQFNVTRGYGDWDNHRNSVFNTDTPRDDAMLFGEHLADPPSKDDYISAGMRIADNDVYNDLKYACAGYGNLTGQDQPGRSSKGVNTAVIYAGSHDYNDMSTYDRPTADALLLTRAGLPIIYSDGYNESTYFNGSKYFPQHGNNNIFGEFNDKHIPNLLYIHQLFSRGDQFPMWSDTSYVAYERRDYRETGDDGNATVLAFMAARNGAGGQSRAWNTKFGNGARLKNYSIHGGGFYVNVSGNQIKNDSDQNPVVPAGGYFAFSWRVPEMPAVWDDGTFAEVKPITILEDGQQVGTMLHTRKDGYAGDPNFNPYGVAGDTGGDYKYSLPIPRVTKGSNLTFLARADGSAIDIRLQLDGGIDLNSQMALGPQTGGRRDYGPGSSWDFLLGTESMKLKHRVAEKFAAKDTARNVIGSGGSETYLCTIGSAGFGTNLGAGVNFTDSRTVTWFFHDPAQNNVISTNLQFDPPPALAAGQPVSVWAKVGYATNMSAAWLYYTTNGVDYPEGSAGQGKGTTLVVPLTYQANGTIDSGSTSQWWMATLPALPNGTVLRYKIGAAKFNASDIFPFSGTDHSRIKKMETLFMITNFNAETVGYYPHADYSQYTTGLVEGFHVLREKAFINRGGAASIYNLNVQTFYYDTKPPQGAIIFPANDGDDLFGSSYGVVVRGDRTVDEAWFRITDSDPDNDDALTGANSGNGTWVKASEVTANPTVKTPYPREWRFDYVNVAASNTATIEVRMREATSSTNMALNDVDGHFTTLTRVVDARGPAYRLFIPWPPADGDVVGEGYVMKAAFTEIMANGISSNDLINCFTLRIDTNVQPKALYSIKYGEQPGYHALSFTLPNLYNDDPETLHVIEVTLNRPGYPLLQATRLVHAQPVNKPYVTFVTPPASDVNGNAYTIVLPEIASPAATQRQYLVEVDTATNAQSVNVYLTKGTGTLEAVLGNPVATNSLSAWYFTWQFPLTNNKQEIEGTQILRVDVDTDGNTNTVEAFALRETRVVLREIVAADTNDIDDDDDGIADFDELTAKGLPSSQFTSWNNGDVHTWVIYGRSDPLSPDADGDGLSDGLELGWRNAGSNTSTIVDTDGDGFPNFRSDLDPPFYNTCDNFDNVPTVSECNTGSKTDLKAGTMTNPNDPDTDHDGLPDGIEDANRNGWVDGDGASIAPTSTPSLARSWPDRSLDISDTWTETDPNNSDTDKDGLSDGFGEDKNANGRIDGDVNSNRVYDAGEEWTESNPLEKDTDGDSLPDGWESFNQFDPLDNGSNSLRTAAADDGNPVNGAGGDPDGDGLNNLTELVSGKNPRFFDTGAPPPVGAIIIGTGTYVKVGASTNRNDFTDWTYQDLLALDPYDPLNESNGGDVYYRPWASDGLERSRDLVAFYAHDGGAVTNGGDDNMYFRVDMHNLQASAEDSGLDIYVVIDTGNTAVGERKVLNNVDVLTDMRWEVIVVVDDWNLNNVYVNKPGSLDTDTLSDTVVFGPDDVEIRDTSHPYGFKKVHFNSNMDAVEFSISRKALLDAGWAGDFNALHFQVFTTRENVELDGPDIADSIRTDWIAEDFTGTKDVADVDQARYEGRINLKVLSQWIGINADNDRGMRIKIMPLIHRSQHADPGSMVQPLVNNGAGAGLYRPFDVHQAYGVPLTLHITPLMASALQWAKVDTNAGPSYKDGPSLNARIAELASSNVVCLLGSTFSDHAMPYFTKEFNRDNVALARDYLASIYGSGVVSTSAFYTPERLVDADVLDKVKDAGYGATFIDQSQHLRRWFGLPASTGEDAYRVNDINGVHCFVVDDNYSAYRFGTLDNGPSLALREILNRRARSGWWGDQHPQIITFFYNWEEFGDKTKADDYDKIIGWMASRGWIQIVTPDQILKNQIDISLPPDGTGDSWNKVNRGTGLNLAKTSHDWVQFGSQENYDNWYIGSGLNQSLQQTKFAIRSGTNMPKEYGMLYFGGIVSDAWFRVNNMLQASNALGRLARSTMHASVYETAFHKQTQNPLNLTKFSTGDWAYPDGSFDNIDDFARIAQAQSRMAAIYARVEQWANAVPSFATTQPEDVDLDGELEYLLYNDRLFCLFERVGGRLVGAWVRNVLDGEVYQAAGNFAGYAGSESEEMGTFRVNAQGALGAYRMSLLTDWWAGTAQYINGLYTFSNQTNGWLIVSTNGAIAKTVSLGDHSSKVEVQYQLSGPLAGQALYVRNGFSPDLGDLIVNGQKTLGPESHTGGVMTLVNSNYVDTVKVSLGYSDAGHSASFNQTAVDDDPGLGFDYSTMKMRNLAQTHQVELVGTNAFAFALGFQASASDWDGDGIPNKVEDQNGLNPGLESDGGDDKDHDGVKNKDEYVANTDLSNSNDFLHATHTFGSGTGIVVRFPTKSLRDYFIWYSDDALFSPVWHLATSNAIPGTGGLYEWLDDGSKTSPHPLNSTNRTYLIQVDLPQ